MKNEQGFTLVELLVSTALILMASMSVLMLVKSVGTALPMQFAGGDQTVAVRQQIRALQNDATTSDAIFSPNANEVDFFALTNAADTSSDVGGGVERPGLYWKYLYDSAARTLERYDYAPSGLVGRRALNGEIDPNGTYPVLHGVSDFHVRMIPANELVAGSNVYAPALAGVSVRALPVNVGGPGITGGNQVTEVSLTTQSGVRTLHLLAGTMPSGFTVLGKAVYKAVLYREDHTHRFLFGLAGHTDVIIKGRVFVSYDGYKHTTPWCDYNIYKNANEDYTPTIFNDSHEKPAYMMNVCGAVLHAPLPRANPDGSFPPDTQMVEGPVDWYEGHVGTICHSALIFPC